MTQPVPPPQEPPPQPPVGGIVTLVLLEAAFATAVQAALALWLAAALAAILAAFIAYRGMPDPSAIWSTLPQWQRQVDRLITDLINIARKGWEAAAAQLGVDLPFDPSDPILQEQLQRTRNLLVRIPDEVYRTIIHELDTAIALGEDVQQQAARVRRVLELTGSENWPARARTVAVTEVHRAWNFGALALALRADQQDAHVLVKRWVSHDDTRTRPAHDRADGQTVPVSDPFIVDGEALMAPLDPAGSPSNVINCRCKPRFFWRK